MKNKEIKYIIGVDEVGRGPIAGPVAVGAFIIPCTSRIGTEVIEDMKKEFKIPLRDSKKLTKKYREKWFKYFKEAKERGECDFVVSFVSSEMIDKFGIKKCIQKALNKSLSIVTSKNQKFFLCFTQNESYTTKKIFDFSLFNLFLDGGLKAPEEYVNQKTIIKGDETYDVISCASIVAKVSRDRIMHQYSIKYPEYGFDKHVGYGTKAHYSAIKKHGQITIHRKSFIH